jgi:7-cyano-7-deazaguanine synthase
MVASLLADKHKVKALSVDYGQKHRKELVFARRIAEHYGIEHQVADLRAITPFLAGSSQTSNTIPVPEGHYTEPSMKLTVVPNRNMIMLSVALAWAISLKYDAIAYGAHAGDHAIYPDCRKAFTEQFALLAAIADWHPVELIAPFIQMTKQEITAEGHKLGVPFEKTWSCYKGGMQHCGKCGTCVERREAFALAGVTDPTEYE